MSQKIHVLNDAEGVGGALPRILLIERPFMSSQFAAVTTPLGQLLSTPHIVQAPPYQRSFAWTHQEAGRLLEDVAAALEDENEGDEYFLGTMLFIEPGKPALRLPGFARAPRVLEVVDGLQRLTTLTVVFCIMRDLDQNEGERPNERVLTAIATAQGPRGRQRLALRDPDEAFFRTHVRNPGATRMEPANDRLSPGQARILDVREHLLSMLGDYDAAQRRRLAEFLLERCHVVMVSTTGIDRAHRMFTVLNATGKPLARNDILKADLLGNVRPSAMESATATWDAAEARLGDEFETVFSHIRAMYGRPSAHVISGIRGIASQVGGGEAFIGQILQPAAAIYEDIGRSRHGGSPHSRAIATSLTYLGWLRGGDWVPPAMLWWKEKGEEAAGLAWFLGALDRLSYALRILGHGTNRRLKRFGAIVHAIRNGHNLKDETSPLALTREELRTIHHNLRDLHARSAPMAKLVLLRLNDHMAGGPQVLPIEDLTVEHLLPRKPGVNSPWRAWFPDPADRDQHTESLGNLVLVTKAQNDRAGNLDFARKKDVLFRLGNAPLLPINDYVRRQSEWKAQQIREREAELLRQLDALWGIGGAPRAKQAGSPTVPSKRRKEPQAAGA